MAAVQKGTNVKISYGDLSHTGYLAQDAELSLPNGNIEEVRDVHGAMHTKVMMDPGQRLSLTFVILDELGITVSPPIQGDTVKLTPPHAAETSYYCESASTAFTAGATRLTLELLKEDTMNYAVA